MSAPAIATVSAAATQNTARPGILHQQQAEPAGRRDQQVAQRAEARFAGDGVARDDADGQRQEQRNADHERGEGDEQPVLGDLVEEGGPAAGGRRGSADGDRDQDRHAASARASPRCAGGGTAAHSERAATATAGAEPAPGRAERRAAHRRSSAGAHRCRMRVLHAGWCIGLLRCRSFDSGSAWLTRDRRRSLRDIEALPRQRHKTVLEAGRAHGEPAHTHPVRHQGGDDSLRGHASVRGRRPARAESPPAESPAIPESPAVPSNPAPTARLEVMTASTPSRCPPGERPNRARTPEAVPASGVTRRSSRCPPGAARRAGPGPPAGRRS